MDRLANSRCHKEHASVAQCSLTPPHPFALSHTHFIRCLLQIDSLSKHINLMGQINPVYALPHQNLDLP